MPMAAPGSTATAPAAALSLSVVEAQAEALASELCALGAHVRAVRAADAHVAQWAAGFGKCGRGGLAAPVGACRVGGHRGRRAGRI